MINLDPSFDLDPSYIDVEIDDEGQIEYTISTIDFNDTQDIQDILEDDVVKNLNAVLDDIQIINAVVDETITVVVLTDVPIVTNEFPEIEKT
eukprot:UN03730